MYSPQRIVIPVDFSEPSRAAAQRGRVIATAFEASIHLVHAIHYPIAIATAGIEMPPSTWDSMRVQARERLDRLGRELAEGGLAVSTEVVESEPVDAIASAVDAQSPDLIAMGSHGYSGLKHVALGSIAERTLRTVDCPILCVKETKEDAGQPIRRIVYATDFSRHAKRAGMLAQGIAKQFGASVDVVHTFVLPGDAVGPYGVPPAISAAIELRERAMEMLEKAAQQFENSQIQVSTTLLDGMPSEAIAREAERLEADMIAMGTRGHTGLKHVFLGSVAERTLRAAHCSVLTTRDAAAE